MDYYFINIIYDSIKILNENLMELANKKIFIKESKENMNRIRDKMALFLEEYGYENVRLQFKNMSGNKVSKLEKKKFLTVNPHRVYYDIIFNFNELFFLKLKWGSL